MLLGKILSSVRYFATVLRAIGMPRLPRISTISLSLKGALPDSAFTRSWIASLTLVLLIGASVIGAWIGAGIVSAWERRKVQRGMAIALLVAATLTVLRMTGVFPGGGDAVGLRGALLIAGGVGNFVLGALMTLGIGLYAPCMAMVSLFGMNPRTAFPIMMGSCAFLMPVASARFLRTGRYDRASALGLAIGGVPAVLLAAFVVKSLPLDAVRVLVVAVITYTAVRLWLDSRAP